MHRHKWLKWEWVSTYLAPGTWDDIKDAKSDSCIVKPRGNLIMIGASTIIDKEGPPALAWGNTSLTYVTYFRAPQFCRRFSEFMGKLMCYKKPALRNSTGKLICECGWEIGLLKRFLDDKPLPFPMNWVRARLEKSMQLVTCDESDKCTQGLLTVTYRESGAVTIFLL